MKPLLLGLALVAATAGAQAQRLTPPTNLHIVKELFASPNGTSGNQGTVSSPWSVAYALAHAGASNIVTLLPGTYPSIDISDPIRMSGLTLRSQTKWGARIVGSPGMHGIATEVGVSNVVIDGFEIAYPYISGVKLNDSWSTVRNCWIHHAAKGDPSAVLNTNKSYYGSGIEAHNKWGTLVENNLIEYCGLWIRHDHGIYLNGTNNIVRNNVFRYNLAHGIQVYEDPPQAAANCFLYNNLLYGNGRGIVVYTQNGCTNYVFSNTIITTTNAVESAPLLVRRAPTVIALNNICLGAGFAIASDDGTPITEDYNLVSVRGSGAHDIVTSSTSFANPGRGLYWLGTGSVARGAATSTRIPPVNFFGNVQTNITDIGAFQYDAALAVDTRVLDPSPPGGADYWAR